MDDLEAYRDYLKQNPIDFDPEFDRVTFCHATASDKILKGASMAVDLNNQKLLDKRRRETERDFPYYADPPFEDD